jgi:Transglutaminase-like superfamily
LGFAFTSRVVVFAISVPLLGRLGFHRLKRILGSTLETPLDGGDAERLTARLDRALMLGWPVVKRTCLVRGVTRCYFLRRAGFDVQLTFGIAARDGRPTGHCWLVKDGQPFLEPSDPRSKFTALHTIPCDDRRAAP